MLKTISLSTVFLVTFSLTTTDVFAQRGGARTGILKPHYGGGGGGGGARSAGPSYSYGRSAGPSFSQPAYVPPVISQPATPYVYRQPIPYSGGQALAQADSYRTFSVEPIGVRPGDTVVVARDNARLMLGQNQVGTAPQGLRFEVTKVINGWLGASTEIDGRQVKGWVWHGDVQAEQ